MMSHRASRNGVLGCSLVLFACSSADNDDGVVLNVVAAEHQATIGTLDGPEETLLGRVTSVAVDRDGRVYVADGLGSTVRAFGADGAFLGWIGQEGEGPGEYTGPNDLVFGADGRLFVRDAVRVTALTESFQALFPDSVAWTASIPGYGVSWSRRGGATGQRYLYPSGGSSGYFYLPVDSTGFGTDTLRVPDAETMRAHRTAFAAMPGGVDGFMVRGLNPAPFEPAAQWDVTSSGSVVFTDGATYLVSEVGARGDTIVSWSGPRAPRTVDDGARRDSATALRERVDSLPMPLSQVRNVSPWVEEGRLPEVLPAAIAVHVSREGNVWVRQWPTPDKHGSSVFDVFDRLGTYLSTVTVPADLQLDPPPFVSNEWIAGVVVDEGTGVERVVLFRAPVFD